MGKKYDAWQKAREAGRQAEMRVTDVQGGSTEKALKEAYTNADQARRNEEDTYQQWREDPAG
jgi:vacuolar-type H+-ATPase subunit H